VVLVGSVAIALVGAAVLAGGFPLRQLDLNDTGIWVSSNSAGEFGRFNKAAVSLDSRLSPPGERATEFSLDVMQDGNAVFGLDARAAMMTRIDTATSAPISEQSVTLEATSSVQMRGGTVAVMDRAGRVWAARYDPATGVGDLGALDSSLKPVAELGLSPDVAPGSAALAVSATGTVFVAGINGRLISIAPAGEAFGAPTLTQGRPVLKSVAITTVGESVVAMDVASGLLVLPGGGTVSFEPDPNAKLQQSGPDSASVLMASSNSLARVVLSTGEVFPIDTIGGGAPANPVHLDGCDFGAWAGGGRVVRVCGSDVEAHQVSQGLTAPVFRSNHGLLVLNDQADGLIYDLEHSASIEWPRPDAPRDQVEDDTKDHKQPDPKPTAVQDQFSARSDRTTVLHPLDNDTDTTSAVLSVIEVGTPSPEKGVRLEIAPDGQTVMIYLPAGVPQVRFTYTISDGSARDEGEVTVSDAGSRQTVPTPRPNYTQPAYAVPAFGNLSIPIVSDWRDGEGDPVQLLSARDPEGNAVPVTPAGQIDYSPGDASSDEERVITYEVTDTDEGARVSKSIRVRVLGRDSVTEVAPIAQPDVIRGEVGKPIVISPLNNDVPGADPRNLGARLTLEGEIADQGALSVTTDPQTGQVTVVAKREGSYQLTYGVGFGSSFPAKGTIRVDVIRGIGSQPVAMPDQVAMRGRNAVLIDVSANDYDPAGNLLTVDSATPVDADQLQVQVVEGRWLRIIALVDRLARNPQAVHYTISNGSQTANGDVVVTQLPVADADQVLAREDAAMVRAGDSVLIPALANDVSLAGQQLRLAVGAVGTGVSGQLAVYDPSRRGDAEQGDVGQAYINGDQIRYVAPSSVQGTRQVRISYTAQNSDSNSAQSEVVVTIKPEPGEANPDRAPTPKNIEARVTSGGRIQIDVPSSGQDPDGDSVVVDGIASAPSLGRVVGYGSGSITYEAFPNDAALGSDTFSYVVTDKYGRTGVGSIRVAVTKPAQVQPPVAVDDQITAAPGAELRLNVTANDYLAKDDSVTIAALEPLNNPLPTGAKLAGEAGPILLTAPGENQQPVVLNYALVGNGGTGPSGVVKVVSQAGFNNPPSVIDQTATVDGKVGKVDLLSKAWDIDGDNAALQAELLQEVPGATLVGSQYTVPLTDHAQVIPYRVIDAAGATSAAVVYVPAMGAGVPRVKSGANIEVATDSAATINLSDYVESPRGNQVRIADAKTATAPGSDLEVKVIDSGTFSLVSKAGYTGPASVTLDVMDAATLTEDGVLTSTVSIPVQVGTPTPVLRCPTTPQEIIQGGDARRLDITTLCHVWSPDPGSLAGLTYTADWDTPMSGVEVSAGARQVQLQASGSAVSGTATLRIGIAGTAAKSAKLTVKVAAAPRPKLRSLRLTDIKAGSPVTVPLSLSSPLVDAQSKILSVTQLSGDQLSFTQTDQAVVFTPGVDASGTFTFRVVATDLAASPEREDRQATGTVTLQVYARPSRPGAPKSGSTVQSSSASLSWAESAANGAAVDFYNLRIASGTGTGRQIQCPSIPCRFTGLKNGDPITFQAQAHNRAGLSEWSAESAPIIPDTAPGAPSSVSVSDPQDKSVVVSWGSIGNDGSPLTKILITYGGRTTEAAPGTTSKKIVGLDNNQVYTFTVAAQNSYGVGGGTSQKGQSSGRPLGLSVDTPVPTDVVGATTQTKVSWSLASANGPTPTTYDVVRSDGKRICAQVTTRSCSDDSVTFDGTAYTYKVTATNATGGSEHAATDASPTWRATGTPDAWDSWTAAATGADGKADITFTVPTSRGATTTVAVVNGSSVVKSLGSAGGARAEQLTGLTDGHQYDLRMRVCNEAQRCSYSSTKSVTTFGPLADPTVSASASGKNLNASGTGDGNGATATLSLYVNGVLVDSATGTGALSVSRANFEVGYSTTAQVRVRLSRASDDQHSFDGRETFAETSVKMPEPTVHAWAGSMGTRTSAGKTIRYWPIYATTTGLSGAYSCIYDKGINFSQGTYRASGALSSTKIGEFQVEAGLGFVESGSAVTCDGVRSNQYSLP